ncbi:hypothetical protein B0A55_06000 [Friedmanniomyces simplex]|uniref:Uncharacterized protein n=1 Tax=Friedmanniomyces simplex TaxID=329884 RepID=A0A4U0XJW3_9PEZI|nr:hypothetical protein B0A55_06000 [Friedmanniomyces simplex]
MSDRGSNTARPARPTIASNRAARTPLTPRIAGSVTPTTRSTVSKTPSTVRSEPPKLTPRVKQEGTPSGDALTIGNVTPRSSARKSRVDSSQSTPTQADEPSSLPRPTSSLAFAHSRDERGGSISALDFTSPRAARSKSIVSDIGGSRGRSPPLVLSPGRFDFDPAPTDSSIDSRFFHASDLQKPEPAPKKVEIKKAPTFVYADGQHEGSRSSRSSQATSPVLSAVSEQRSSGPWIRAESMSNPSKSPPLLSPALSTISNTSPFFAAATGHRKPRSPSPSKENIHLSYRKGASQIFGTRPTPRQTDTGGTVSVLSGERRGSSISAQNATPHRKSPSLSSIDSGNSNQSRRRSATTTIDGALTPSPLNHEVKSATVPRVAKAVPPSIDTSLDPPGLPPPPSVSAFSPTKTISDLAADARRERKVLDLEISNSSLLAINASLEREVRRQKAELKRFRRLSRAGRFSMGPGAERTARFSEGLSVVGEDGEGNGDGGYGDFGPPSGFTDLYDDFSASSSSLSDDDGESESLTSEPLSPTTSARKRSSNRLDRDERRLRVDLAKHKELLVQSQMMNQSLKRCLFSTEDMIREGKKALEYHVRVSDVKMGGRILTGHEDEDAEDGDGEGGEEELVVDDEFLRGDDETAEEFMKVWEGVGRLGFEGSDGDRDSGIEVDRPPIASAFGLAQTVGGALDSGRPPDAAADGDAGG